MKVTDTILMKHSGMKARDLEVTFEADIGTREIVFAVDWIDSGLIEWLLAFGLRSAINSELERSNMPTVASLDGFMLDMVVAGKARFSVRRVERDFNPPEPTLVMHLKD